MNGYYNNFDNYTQQSTQNTYTPAPQVTKKKPGGAKVAALALCFSLLGGAVGTGGTYLMMNNSQSNTSAVAADSSSSSEITASAAGLISVMSFILSRAKTLAYVSMPKRNAFLQQFFVGSSSSSDSFVLLENDIT